MYLSARPAAALNPPAPPAPTQPPQVSSYGSSGSGTGSEEDSLEGGAEGDDVLYDDDTLKDFLVEFDDESADADFDFDSPASDY